MAQRIVYALTDPRTDEIRYVGKSSIGLERPKDHSRPARIARERTYKANWIRSLQSLGLKPVIEIVEECASEPELLDAEIFWIAQFRALGFRLTNLTDGGDGCTGRVLTAEHKSKIGAANTGIRNGMFATHGRKSKPEDRAKISRALRGEGNGCARLDENDVIAIRSLSADGMERKEIAKRFDIDPSHVSNLVNRKAWKHVQ